MAELTEQHRDFLQKPYVGTVTTLRKDGSPHNTIVWVDVEDGVVVFNTAEGRAKPEHLRQDPRAAITVVDPQDPYTWISVSGPTRMSHEDGDAWIDRLSDKYTGNPVYQSRQPGEQRVTVRITPEHVDSRGFSD